MSISERKVDPICCCNEVMKTAFCPHCGTSKAKAKISAQALYPRHFTVYLHDHDNYDLYELVKKLGLSQKDKLYNQIMGCAYEIELEYEITENGQVNLIAVNETPLVNKEFEKDDLIITKSVGLCMITTVLSLNPMNKQIFVRPLENASETDGGFPNEFEIFKDDILKHYKSII